MQMTFNHLRFVFVLFIQVSDQNLLHCLSYPLFTDDSVYKTKSRVENLKEGQNSRTCNQINFRIRCFIECCITIR